LSIPANYTRHFKLSAFLLFSPVYFFAQSLTGLWTGVLSNDSASVRKDQSFEIALTEIKGKVYGYSINEFMVNDTLYFIVKRVYGTIEGDVCEVSDDEIITHNFRRRPDKGVKVTSTFRRNKKDSSWYLDGTWKTNITKKYYSVTGKVSLSEEKDLSLSKIFPHLEELNLANDVAFYKERKQEPVIAKVAKPERINSDWDKKPSIISSTGMIAVVKPELQKAETDASLVSAVQADAVAAKINKAPNDLPKTNTKTILPVSTVAVSPVKPAIQKAEVNGEIVSSVQADAIAAEIKKPEGSLSRTNTKTISFVDDMTRPVAVIKPVENNKPISSVAASVPPAVNTKTTVPVTKPAETKTSVAVTSVPEKKENKQAVVASTTANTTNPPVVSTAKQPEVVKANEPKTIPVSSTVTEMKPVARKTDAEVAASGAVIAARKSEFAQVVNFKSDSLVLSLYDNGEIDGDTVSVFMNGQPLMVKQGLKAYAIRKTVYISKDNEDFNLVLFADNLGKYPPNTGLLVVRDGEDIYNIRFSSDLQKSSGILFRKKK
jgi:hypothetical protein